MINKAIFDVHLTKKSLTCKFQHSLTHFGSLFIRSRKCMRLLLSFSRVALHVISLRNNRDERDLTSLVRLWRSALLNRKRCVRFSWVASAGMDRKQIWIEFELSGEEPMMSYHNQLPRNMRGNTHFPAHIFTLLLFCIWLPCAPQLNKLEFIYGPLIVEHNLKTPTIVSMLNK